MLLAAVSEDAPNGSIVVQVRTTDADLPEHSTKMYYISGGNEQGHFRFVLPWYVKVDSLMAVAFDFIMIQTY